MQKKSLTILGQNENIESEGLSRRSFLKVLGAATATTAVACADKADQIIYPNVKGDATQIPGVPSWYSSTCTQCDAGCGVNYKTYEGRVTIVEGNKSHPINKGGLCAIGHSALQDHYDPDRVRQPLEKDSNGVFQPITWKAAYTKIKQAMVDNSKRAFLTKPLNGSLEKLVAEWSKDVGVEHYTYEPLDYSQLAKATAAVYGANYNGVPHYDFSKAEVVVNFGADFLETWISPCEFSRDWAKSRKSKKPVRVFQVEPRLSLTGANADHHLKCKPGTELLIAKAILKELLSRGKNNLPASLLGELEVSLAGISIDVVAKLSNLKIEKIVSAAQRLAEAKTSLVIAGGASAKTNNEYDLQVVCALINRVLGNVGQTINLDRLRAVKSDFQKVKSLIAEINDNKYSVLFVDGSNPLFTIPSDYKFGLAIKKLDLVVSFASHLDETTKEANLVLPASSSIESWGDHQPYVGVNSLVQPAMTPVFDTVSLGDMLLKLTTNEALKKFPEFQDYLKAQWQQVHASAGVAENFETFWKKSLERGGYFAEQKSVAQLGALGAVIVTAKLDMASFDSTKIQQKSDLVLLPYASVKTFDGRAANRPWMQELPDPITKIAWDTWAEINTKTAEAKKIKTGDLVKISNYYGELNVPAYVTDHVDENVIAVPLGNGHSDFGRYASSVGGGNVYNLIPSDKADHLQLFTAHVELKRALGKRKVANTQDVKDSDKQGDRGIARTTYIETKVPGEHKENHEEHGAHHEPEQMYIQREHPLYQWGMVVDLAACTGCSACVTACYAENNIPTVGRKIMTEGREMSWLRLERYDDGTSEDLQISFIPAMCQHCQNAPCEPVCPVYATYHNEDGLNVMVYNRCVGTRYCANNCVYKQRRFNWYEYELPEPLDMQLNPEVMKRVAGVMEKCSFCVHRIKDAKDHAKDEGRLVADGEVQPACVKSCPTEALVFGDLNDPNSRVSKLAKHERAYKILDHHLNTQPSVSYLDNLKYKA